MSIQDVTDRLLETKLLAIIRGDYLQHIHPIAQALLEGGVHAIEVTTNSPGYLDMIEQLRTDFGDELLVGAGTVLTANHVEAIAGHGGQFVVSPDTYSTVIEAAYDHELVPMPGAYTPTEVRTAQRAGAKLVKLFPASTGGPLHIKQILAPLDDAHIFATGGINTNNLADFLRAGVAGVGLGSSLIASSFDGSDNALEDLIQRATTLRQIVNQHR